MIGESGETEIRLLGGFRLIRRGRVVLDGGWNRRKALALLKLIAVQPAGQMLRDEVCEALWPEMGARAATNNLHKNLHHLRTALEGDDGDGEVLLLSGDVVRLASDVRVDLREFFDLAAAALRSDDPAAFDQALQLGRGDLLPEDAYEEWTQAARSRLHATRAELLRAVVALQIRARQWERAIERARELVEVEPTDEDAHRALMQLYVQVGSRHRALRQFEDCREALQAGLGVEPSAATSKLYARLLEESPAAEETSTLGGVELPPPPDEPAPAPRPITYGRERELEVIEQALDDVTAGRGVVLFLLGEAGIGKSHLLEHVRAAAQEQGTLAAYGRGYEFDAHIPYQPWRGILRELQRSPAARGLEQMLRRSLYLRRLLPDAPPEPAAADSEDLQAELFEEMWRLFSTLAAERPLVLMLDDLNYADQSSLRLLHFLARRAPEARIALVVTARTERGAGQGEVGALLSTLRRDGIAREIEVRALDRQALQLVARSVFEDHPVEQAILDELVERSDGNPLFARELAKAFVEQGWARLERGRWRRRPSVTAPVPVAVRDLLERRLEYLSDAARDLLNASAVAATAASLPVLQAASGLEYRAALDALDECIGVGLLEESGAGYRFRHDLVRQAAYATLTLARRQQLHRALAEAMLARPDAADPGIVSHHLTESEEPWRAVGYLLESGRRAQSVFAYELARDTLEQAVRLVREHDRMVDATLAGQTLEALGDLERRLGDAERSVELFEEATHRFESVPDDEAAARARGKAALGHIIRGDAAAAQRHIEQTLHSLTETSDQHVVSRTYYLLAQFHWHSGKNQDALEAAKQALLAAQDTDDPMQQAQAYEVLALACHSLGDWQQGIGYELQRQAIGVSGFDTDEAFDAHL